MKCPTALAKRSFAMPALALFAAVCLAGLSACEDKKASTPPAQQAHTHEGHDHEHTIALGEVTIGKFTVKATRDEGEIAAGKDAAIDLTVVPLEGSGAQVGAVRFWIGAEDAKGSVKAKGEIEDPQEPNRWHAHAEIPNPIPDGAKLWVEVEDSAAAVAMGSFDLKR